MKNTVLLISLIFVFCLAPAGSSADDIILHAVATVDTLDSGQHHFGIRAGSVVGLDSWDLAEPPHPPSDYLSLAFAMPGDEVPLPNRWRDEFRSLDDLDDGLELWILHVESDRLGQTAFLTIDLDEGPDHGLTVHVLGPASDRLGALPMSIPIVLSEEHQVLWIEVEADASVPLTSSTWSVIKRSFR